MWSIQSRKYIEVGLGQKKVSLHSTSFSVEDSHARRSNPIPLGNLLKRQAHSSTLAYGALVLYFTPHYLSQNRQQSGMNCRVDCLISTSYTHKYLFQSLLSCLLLYTSLSVCACVCARAVAWGINNTVNFFVNSVQRQIMLFDDRHDCEVDVGASSCRQQSP